MSLKRIQEIENQIILYEQFIENIYKNDNLTNISDNNDDNYDKLSDKFKISSKIFTTDEKKNLLDKYIKAKYIINKREKMKLYKSEHGLSDDDNINDIDTNNNNNNINEKNKKKKKKKKKKNALDRFKNKFDKLLHNKSKNNELILNNEEKTTYIMEKNLINIDNQRMNVYERRKLIQKYIEMTRNTINHWILMNNHIQAEQSLIVYQQALRVKHEHHKVINQLNTFMQTNVANDCFFIWYSGPYGTISDLKLGRLPNDQVEWNDINAALGQCALLLSVLANRAGYRFKEYNIIPFGSFSKIAKKNKKRKDGNKRIIYDLYSDGGFSFFPKSNFNAALTAFLYCVQEFANFTSTENPSLTLPYRMEGDRIENISITLSSGSEEKWSIALKYLLTNLKWLTAWTSKHTQI